MNVESIYDEDLEKSLRRTFEKEELYRIIEAHSPTGIAICRDGIVLYANPFALEIIQDKDVVGKSINSYLHPDSHPFVKQEEFQVKEEKMPQKTEIKLIRKNGEIIIIEAKKILINYKGSPAILILFNDETERKRTEREYKQSLKNLEDINFALNESSIVAITDKRGVIQFVNNEFCRMSQYSEEELIGKDHRILNSGYHSKDFFKNMWRTIGKGKTWKGEIRNKAKDGSYYWVNTTIVPFLDDNGELYQYVSIRTDITERKEVEEALRKSEMRYRLIAENMTDLVYIIDYHGFFKYASPSYLTILGFPHEVYEGKKMEDFIHCDDYDRVRNDLNNMVVTKKGGVFEYRFRDIKNNWVWLEAKVTPVFDEGGQFNHFLAVSRDITERKMYEEKITHMAYHDMLTDLPNRRLFIERLTQSINKAERNHTKLAVMYMDLDKFKYINDTYGHDVGDELLKQFAERVQGCIRESDHFSRKGGDEFTILLPSIKKEQDAIYMANRIINSLQETWQIKGHHFKTTSSIGISFYPKDGETVDELMKSSDIALYRAKEEGGNNFKVFSSET